MNKNFIPYEQALALKKLMFNIRPDFGNQTSLYNKDGNHVFYTNYGVMGSGLSDGYIYAPLKYQVFQWFREKHKLDCFIDRGGAKGIYHAFVGGSKHGFLYGNNGNSPSEFTYEEAEIACIDKLIELLKK